MLAFNRGLISPLALGRIDLERTALSSELDVNWMTRVLGSTMLRPGLGYQWATKDNAQAKLIPFVFSTSQTALVEVTGSALRVWDGSALVSRPAVSAPVTNGGFDADVSGWTDADEVGATSQWATGGYLSLQGNGSNSAKRYQAVATSNAGIEHALRIVIERGPVTLSVGTSAGDDSYISATLKTGTHSLTFTPTGTFYIQFESARKYSVLVDSVATEASGVMELPSPWAEADLGALRFDQSGDVIFVACGGYQQRRIERRSDTAWSIVKYEPEDGPFRGINLGPITLTPSALSGDISVTASSDFFETDHLGALFRLTAAGQQVEADLSAADTFTDPVRVTGIGSSRVVTINISGSFSGTLTLQRSPAAPGSWTDVKSWTLATTEQYNDGLDNQVIFYRVGFKAGDYTSGTASVSLTFPGGTSNGVIRLTQIVSGLSAQAVVLEDLGGTEATSDWEEGAWSKLRGWPSAVALYEGRLWWAGGDYIWGSESDAYEDFDDQ
ncbi:MAG TPA: hypothetical protein DCF82_23365, partial [Marinobacter hydrocarbonoclasticus]|nr:hypothetical protein [Marinobacter nauticus]